MIHALADVQTKNIGENTDIWQFSVVLNGATIGTHCNINCHCFIENDVVMGNNVTVKSGVYLWNGLRIEDNVFIGPSVVFSNDLFPRSKQYKKPLITFIRKGASIGANAVILGGIEIGAYSMIGIGSVVTKNIPSHALVYGNPAQIKGWVDENGNKLSKLENGNWISEQQIIYMQTENGLVRI